MTRTTRPPALRLGGRDYKFRYRLSKHMPDIDGLCHNAKALIDIRLGQLPIDETDTVLHEVFHAILHCQGREDGGDVEETYVRALATGLTVALQDNPEFTTWLLHRFSPPPK